MKTCQTCGKILRSSMEEFTVNGFVQCEDCAHSRDPKMQEAVRAVKENVNKDNTNQISNSWIGILKTIAKINMVVGIIASIVIAVFVYKVTYSGYDILFAFTAFVVGVVLSVMSSALLMVFAEMAEDISIIRYIIHNK